ncbi:unnamed protein product, partial [Urochloa humidicola]
QYTLDSALLLPPSRAAPAAAAAPLSPSDGTHGALPLAQSVAIAAVAVSVAACTDSPFAKPAAAAGGGPAPPGCGSGRHPLAGSRAAPSQRRRPPPSPPSSSPPDSRASSSTSSSTDPTAEEDCFRTFHFAINDVVLDPHVQGCRVMHGALAHQAVAVSREVFFVVVSLTRHCCCHCSLASGCCLFL